MPKESRQLRQKKTDRRFRQSGNDAEQPFEKLVRRVVSGRQKRRDYHRLQRRRNTREEHFGRAERN